MDIKIKPGIRKSLKELRLGWIKADVIVRKFDQDLWDIIKEVTNQKEVIMLEEIKFIPEIKSSRKAYKRLGKDPSRYRLSAEALHRRIVRGLGLYQINNVVDILNLISLKSGFSIGGYDSNKINGNISLKHGKKEDVYEAIGRGVMNIENLPVFHDEIGPFGTPTSDSARTMITEKTKNILFVFMDFGNHDALETFMKETEEYLIKFAQSKSVETWIVQ